MFAVLDEAKLRRVLTKMLDENEFFSPYGIRSLSRYHADHPYVFHTDGQDYGVGYLPAESDSGMFGGNSNWRGPIWMPVNALIIRALLQYYAYYGDDFTVECPTGSGRRMNLYQVAEEIGRRLAAIFLKDGNGRRPVYGGCRKFQEDPHWRDCLLFYEYFHGDNGAGLGASHQTGWTGVLRVPSTSLRPLARTRCAKAARRRFSKRSRRKRARHCRAVGERKMNRELLDAVPLWGLLLASVALLWLAMEGGYRLGKWRHARTAEEKDAPVGAMGYQAGLSAIRRSPAMFLLVLTFAGVLFIIADLDRPGEGFLRVSQAAMTDLQRSMQPVQP